MRTGNDRLRLLLLGVAPASCACALIFLQSIQVLRLPIWGCVLATLALIVGGALWALRLAARESDGRRDLLDELSFDRLTRHAGRQSGSDDSLDRFGEAMDEIRKSYLQAHYAKRAAEQDLLDVRAEVEKRVAERTSNLAASEESVRLLLHAVPEAIYGMDTTGVCTFCNPACVRLLGYDDESELVGRPVHDLMPIPVLQTQRATRDGRPIHAEKTFWRADGTLFPVEYWSFPVTKGPQVVGAVVTFVDITERKRHEVALFREKERAQITLKAIADGVITTDAAGKVRYLNPAAEALLGWRNAEAIDKPFAAVFEILDPVDHERARNLESPHQLVNNTAGKHGSSLVATGDGTRIFVEHSTAAIRDRDASVIGFIVVFRDVSESRRIARQLAYQATHDPLTGTINRREFERRIERVLKAVAEKRVDGAICFLDLDQFKVVNDTCGHRAGDELLRQIAQLLHGHLRQRDTLARLGGDEFGLLLEGCSLEDAMRIASAIREAIHEFRFGWDDKTFALGASIGVVEIHAELGYTLVEVLSAADAACYLAKEKGRNRIEVHRPNEGQIRQMRGEVGWICRIREALEHDRFQLYFQDIVSLQYAQLDPRSGHVEILVRMLDRDGNIAVPGAFLPAAERHNVVQATDRWVVRKVFTWLSERDPGSGPAQVSINLSGPTVSDASFADFVLASCEEAGVEARRVCFEINEGSAIAKLTHVSTLVQKLSHHGFRFALDDFGSGLSSFGHLRQLPVDYVKIDGAFVKDVLTDPVSRAMVRSINDIGHIMGKQTVAEYVESAEIMSTLRELGIDYAQGYGISAPKPLEAFDAREPRAVSNA